MHSTEKTQTILYVSAHPDDEVGSAGGTLLLYQQRGYRIALCLLTSGEDEETPESVQIGKQRVAEYAAVGKALDAIVQYLCYPRYFDFSPATLFPLVRMIRNVRPEIVIAPSTDEEHPEHVMAGRLTKEACRVARRAKYPQCGLPFCVPEFREAELDNTFTTFDVLEDITNVMDGKKQLFQHYASQGSNKDYVSAFAGLNQYRAITKRTGRYAEAFRVTRIL